MYIDHISGSLQNFNNSMRGLQGLAELDEQRRKRQLQASIEAKDRGDNPTAEKLLLASQRGLLGNWFGDDAKEWTVTNPFKKQKQEIYNVNADQGGILAALTNPNSPDYNPDMANLMAQGSPRTLSELSKMKEQGIMNLTPYAVQQQFQPQLQAYAENKQANDKIKAFNKKYEHMESDIGDNEELQQQKILQYAYDSIRTANTPQEQIKAYMDYRTKVKAINDHYGHQMQAESPAFFGIGLGGKAETGSKMEDYHYGRPGDKNLSLVQIPKSLLGNQKRIQQWIKQNYPDYYSEDKGLISRAGTDQGGFLNEQQQLKAEQDKMLLEQAKNDQIEKQIDQRDGVFTRRSTAEKEYIKELAAQGLTIVTDPVTGFKKTVPIGSDVAKKDEEPLW